MQTGTSIMIPLDEPSRVGEARRAALRVAQESGCSEVLLGKIGVVVTEAATNATHHARHGALLLRAEKGDRPGLEMICYDRGPGMADIDRCLTDGFSTRGTAGNGLGAMRRIADRFNLYSTPGRGTVLAMAVGGAAAADPQYRLGAISVCAKGESQCGDAWAVHKLPDRLRIVVADGLGHGPLAAAAAETALRVVQDNPTLGLGELMQLGHRALRSTRGAAVVVAEILFAERKLRYSGVGNISGVLMGPGTSRGLMSHAGIVGHEMLRSVQLDFAWPQRGCLVLHSDGLSAKWNLEPYPGLLAQHPSLIAATVFRDTSRGRDDATVLALTLP